MRLTCGNRQAERRCNAAVGTGQATADPSVKLIFPFHRLAYGPRTLQIPSVIEWLRSGRRWATVGGRDLPDLSHAG